MNSQQKLAGIAKMVCVALVLWRPILCTFVQEKTFKATAFVHFLQNKSMDTRHNVEHDCLFHIYQKFVSPYVHLNHSIGSNSLTVQKYKKWVSFWLLDDVFKVKLSFCAGLNLQVVPCREKMPSLRNRLPLSSRFTRTERWLSPPHPKAGSALRIFVSDLRLLLTAAFNFVL